MQNEQEGIAQKGKPVGVLSLHSLLHEKCFLTGVNMANEPMTTAILWTVKH